MTDESVDLTPEEEAALADWVADESEEGRPAPDLPEVLTLDVSEVEKVVDVPAVQASEATNEVDLDTLRTVSDEMSPQEQLDAYRAAGFPDRLLDVTSGADGRIVAVQPLVGTQP